MEVTHPFVHSSLKLQLCKKISCPEVHCWCKFIDIITNKNVHAHKHTFGDFNKTKPQKSTFYQCTFLVNFPTTYQCNVRNTAVWWIDSMQHLLIFSSPNSKDLANNKVYLGHLLCGFLFVNFWIFFSPLYIQC